MAQFWFLLSQNIRISAKILINFFMLWHLWPHGGASLASAFTKHWHNYICKSGKKIEMFSIIICFYIFHKCDILRSRCFILLKFSRKKSAFLPKCSSPIWPLEVTTDQNSILSTAWFHNCWTYIKLLVRHFLLPYVFGILWSVVTFVNSWISQDIQLLDVLFSFLCFL